MAFARTRQMGFNGISWEKLGGQRILFRILSILWLFWLPCENKRETNFNIGESSRFATRKWRPRLVRFAGQFCQSSVCGTPRFAIAHQVRLRQMACKPGSVPARAGDGHSSGTFVAERLTRPTRTAAGNRHRRPYLVLLPVGLAMPSSLPKPRCALTAPFQPCPDEPSAVCFLLRFPWSRLRRMLSGTVFPWSPDFPPVFGPGPKASGHPAI